MGLVTRKEADKFVQSDYFTLKNDGDYAQFIKSYYGELDLDKFTKLTKLHCGNNSNLTSIINLPDQLEELSCYGCKITQLDTPKIYLMILNKFWVRTINLT